jgi:hypothetical protein
MSHIEDLLIIVIEILPIASLLLYEQFESEDFRYEMYDE